MFAASVSVHLPLFLSLCSAEGQNDPTTLLSSTVLLLTKTKGPENGSVLSVFGVDQYGLKDFGGGQENLCYTLLLWHEYFM